MAAKTDNIALNDFGTVYLEPGKTSKSGNYNVFAPGLR
jgi:hypothetical protein